MRFFYLCDQFEYYVKKFSHPRKKFEIKPRSTFFSDGTTQSHMEMINITSEYPPSPHQTVPPLQSDVKDHSHTPTQLSHPPNITSLNFHEDLVVSPSSCHMNFVPQPPSLQLTIPLDDTVLCSSIPDSTLVLNEEQATDRVSLAQPTCVFIHEEYEWEIEHKHSTNDDCLSFDPPLFLPNIFGEPSIQDFACVCSSTYAPIIDHSSDTLDVNP